MSEPSRTQRYEGLFKSQTQEQFEADARTAADHDWYPASEKWTGPVLFVVYEHDPGRRTRGTAAATAPVQPSGKTPEWDGPAPRGRGRRRVMLAVGLGLVVVTLGAVTMVGTQLLGRPATDGQQAGGNPVATPATPVAAVVPTPPLGSRTAAIDLFRARSYSGVLAPMFDGRDRWRATDKRSSVAEIIGPEERITEVSLAIRVLRAEKRNNKARAADMEFLFANFAPLAAQWAADELELTDSTMARTSEQRFDGLLVRLVSMPVKGGTVVKFQVMTD